MAYAPGSNATATARTQALQAARSRLGRVGAPAPAADPQARLAGVQKALGNRIGRQRMPAPGGPGAMQSVTGGGLQADPAGGVGGMQAEMATMPPEMQGPAQADPMGAGLPPRLQALIQSGAMSPQGAANRFQMFKAGQLPGQQQQAMAGAPPVGGIDPNKPGGPMQHAAFPGPPQPGTGGGPAAPGGPGGMPAALGQLPPQFQQMILQRLQGMGMPQGNYGGFFGPQGQQPQGPPQFAYRGGY